MLLNNTTYQNLLNLITVTIPKMSIVHTTEEMLDAVYWLTHDTLKTFKFVILSESESLLSKYGFPLLAFTFS